MKYTLNIFGGKFQVSKKVFLSLLIPMIIYLIGMVWSAFGGVWRFGENFLGSGWYAMIPAIIIMFEIKVNDIPYGFLPSNQFTETIRRMILWSAVCYYIFTVMNTI